MHKKSSFKKLRESSVQKDYLQKYIVTKTFTSFLPELDNFAIVKEPIPKLKKNEFVVKTVYISVDPYMRSFASSESVPYDQFGFQVGVVIESNNNEYPVGSNVVSHSGWRDYAVLDGEPDPMFQMKPYIPTLGRVPLSMSVGALGMTGLAAYFGLLEILNIKRKDIVCVTSACGGVGSIASQIARIKGCIVIGICGTDEKVNILLEEFGLHHAINYKTEEDIAGKIKAIAPKGINCFFDNTGGQLTEKIYDCLHKNGRVAVCGATSRYGTSSLKDRYIVPKTSCEIQSFSFNQWNWERQKAAMEQIRQWIENGDIKVRETVAVGFQLLPQALISCLRGDNVGKSLVQL